MSACPAADAPLRQEREAERLRVPLARTADGRLVRPAEAVPRALYTCPGCGCRVDRRAGSRRPHFAHHTDADRPCNPETLHHLLAKELIRDAVLQWKAGATAAPVVVYRCAREHCDGVLHSPLREIVADAKLEERVDARWIVDVLLVRADGRPAAAVEVVHSHSMESDKVDGISVPFIEVDAAEIIAEPRAWHVLRSSHERKCERCAEQERRAAEWSRLAGERRAVATAWAWSIADRLGWNVHALRRKYEASIHVCYRCDATMPVFRWHESARPPWPRPPTLRWANEGRLKGWADHCIQCGAGQHPFYVDASFTMADMDELADDPHLTSKRRARIVALHRRLAAHRQATDGPCEGEEKHGLPTVEPTPEELIRSGRS